VGSLRFAKRGLFNSEEGALHGKQGDSPIAEEPPRQETYLLSSMKVILGRKWKNLM
jgi:hypothetical protein